MTHDANVNDSKQQHSLPDNLITTIKRRRRHRQKPIEWLSDPHQAVRGEMGLWAAVITQAMMDALSRSKSSEALYHKHEAINWLTGKSRNFITVCLFAGMDPDYVRRKAKRALASPAAWRAEPGKGKRYQERKAYRKRIRQPENPPHNAESPAGGDKVIRGPWGH